MCNLIRINRSRSVLSKPHCEAANVLKKKKPELDQFNKRDVRVNQLVSFILFVTLSVDRKTLAWRPAYNQVNRRS